MLCGVIATGDGAHAADVAILKPFDTVSLHSPTRPVPTGGPFPYAASGPAASWGIVAWDIPGGGLPPFTIAQHGRMTVATSQAAEASVTVIHAPVGGTAVWLAQNGAALPCLTSGGMPRESDLFLSPNTRPNDRDVSGYAVTGHAYSLTAIRHLTALATVSYSAEPSPKKDVCGVAQGGVLIAVILDNRISRQTLFYQLSLALVCGPQPAKRLAFCEGMVSMPRSGFFFTANPFGVDDRLPLLGHAFLAPGQTTSLHVDLLPRLLGFLRAGPLALDSDPAHWTVGSVYAGQDIWGGVNLATQWSRIQLVADRPH